MANRKSYTGFPTSHQPTKVLRRPLLPQNGDQVPKFVIFHTSFDNKGREVCCKVSLYKSCQRQICRAINYLSSGINILAGVAPFPRYLNAKGPTPVGSTCVVHTSPHSAAAITSLRHLPAFGSLVGQ